MISRQGGQTSFSPFGNSRERSQISLVRPVDNRLCYEVAKLDCLFTINVRKQNAFMYACSQLCVCKYVCMRASMLITCPRCEFSLPSKLT
jgi:hypothetical protein